MSKPSMDKMRQLINKYLADMNLNPLYGAELAQLGKCIRAGNEGGAVRYLREASARTNVGMFEINILADNGVPTSDFTKWLNSTDANLETGASPHRRTWTKAGRGPDRVHPTQPALPCRVA